MIIREAGTLIIIVLVVAFLSLFPNDKNKGNNEGKVSVRPASEQVK